MVIVDNKRWTRLRGEKPTRRSEAETGGQHVITFQYFVGCPNAGETLENLLAVMEELGIPESSLEMVDVPDVARAEEYRFQGSPTILVDGRDIVTGEVPSGFHYTCRVYSFDGESRGAIPRALIRTRLLDWGGADVPARDACASSGPGAPAVLGQCTLGCGRSPHGASGGVPGGAG